MKNTAYESVSRKIKTEMECLCDAPKTFRITMDGGSEGQYVIECCKACRTKEDFRFMIKEEVLKMNDVSSSAILMTRSEDLQGSV